MPAGDISDAMVASVRRRLGEWSTAGLLDAEIFAALNEGQVDLAVCLVDGAMLELTQVATGNLVSSKKVLPANYLRIRRLDIASVRAKYWPISEWDTISGASATNAFYCIWYNTDGVYILVEVGAPASTAAYTLYYIRQPTTISTTVDPDFGTINRQLVEDFAVAQCLRLRQRFGEADLVEAQYRRRITLINSRYTGEKAYEGEAGDPRLLQQ